jgi:Flp pilus assembly protein TadG
MSQHMTLARLLRDQRGATVVEFAFAFPALVVLLYAIAQLGMVYRAMSGIQHALGEGSREAVVWRDPEPTTDELRTLVRNEMNNAVFGIGPGSFNIPSPTAGSTASGTPYLDLTVTYSQPTSLLLFPGPTVSVSRSKRVYLSR